MLNSLKTRFTGFPVAFSTLIVNCYQLTASAEVKTFCKVNSLCNPIQSIAPVDFGGQASKSVLGKQGHVKEIPETAPIDKEMDSIQQRSLENYRWIFKNSQVINNQFISNYKIFYTKQNLNRDDLLENNYNIQT